MGLKTELFEMRGFASTTDALASQRACEGAGVACRLVPRPAALGNAECGMALRTSPSERDAVEEALARAGVRATAFVTMRDFA